MANGALRKLFAPLKTSLFGNSGERAKFLMTKVALWGGAALMHIDSDFQEYEPGLAIALIDDLQWRR
jgi:hypothetical protein